MNPKEENFILQNQNRYSPSELAKKLNLKEREVKRFLQRQEAKKKSIPLFPNPVEQNPKSSLWVFVLFLILGLLIYSNTFNAGFQFDDTFNIENNPAIKNILNFKIIWNFNQERFLGYLTFALNYHFGGLNVFGYHLVNLTIHILASWLVFLLVQITFKTPSLTQHPLLEHSSILALFSSLLFLTHPVQTQAVTYIVQRLASLATLFYLASVFFYAKARLENKRLFYGLALLTTYVSMFTKQTSFTLPFALVLYEFTFFGRENLKSRFLKLAPFLASATVIPLLITMRNVPVDGHNGVLPFETKNISRGDYLLTQFNVIRTYLRLFFLPIRQSLDYDYPISTTMAHLPTLFSLLLHIGIIATAFLLYRNHRIISFGIFWFYLTLSVESSIIPIKDVIYEHRLYLPMFGFALIMPICFCLIFKSIKKMTALFIILILIFSGMTLKRNFVWKDKFTMWEDVIKKSPNKARGYNNLGLIYKKAKNIQKAHEYFEKAVALQPNAPHLVNLGTIYGSLGDIDKEIEYYEKAIQLSPHFIEVNDNLAVAYADKGDYEKAMLLWEKVIQLNPTYPLAYNNLAVTHDELGNSDKAMEIIHKSLAINPDYPETYYALATIYAKNGDRESALKQLDKLKKMNRPDLVSKLEEQLNSGVAANTSPVTIEDWQRLDPQPS